jgi:hypothetical protein
MPRMAVKASLTAWWCSLARSLMSDQTEEERRGWVVEVELRGEDMLWLFGGNLKVWKGVYLMLGGNVKRLMFGCKWICIEN